MSVSITDRSELLSDELRQLAERRLLLALSRFDSRISAIHLVVQDINGPRGGVDKACQLSISLLRAATVVISDKDADMARCISRVTERAVRAVARAVGRRKQLGRTRPLSANPDNELADQPSQPAPETS